MQAANPIGLAVVELLIRKLIRFFFSCLVTAVTLCPNLSAEDKFLSEPELVDLSIEALSGKKSAQQKLIQEYSRYELQIKSQLPLTLLQKELYDEIVETLQIISPEILSPTVTQKQQKIIVKEPESQRSLEKKMRIEHWREEAKRLFPFSAGSITIYTGRSKKIFQEEWFENGKVLKSTVLKVKEENSGKRDILLFNEVLTQQNQYAAEQTLETWQISPAGIRIQKNVVFNQPSPGLLSPVGKQEFYKIVKFPLKQGNYTEGYKVFSTSSTLKAPVMNFHEALLIRGTVENFSFAPNFGLAVREIYDEQWIAKERIVPVIEEKQIAAKDEKKLLQKIRKFCKKNNLKYQMPLSFSISGGDEVSVSSITVKQEEPSPLIQIHSRTFVYRKDKQDPDHKRYQILEQTWTKIKSGEKDDWKLQ